MRPAIEYIIPGVAQAIGLKYPRDSYYCVIDFDFTPCTGPVQRPFYEHPLYHVIEKYVRENPRPT